MYVLSYQHILDYGQLLVLDESLSVLLIVSSYCCNCTCMFEQINDDDDIRLGRTSGSYILCVIMVALCNRADHYIFMLFLLLLLLLSFFLFFPRLISAVGDWMFTILWHMVWP